MPLCIVSVIDETVAVLVLQDRTVTGSGPTSCACDHECAAAFHHRLTAAIDVWTSDVARAADTNVVGAVFAAATEVEGNEEIVVVILANDVRGFDRARQGCGARTGRERVERLIGGGELARCSF